MGFFENSQSLLSVKKQHASEILPSFPTFLSTNSMFYPQIPFFIVKFHFLIHKFHFLKNILMITLSQSRNTVMYKKLLLIQKLYINKFIKYGYNFML
jgi:hypothetical protein